VPKRPAHHARAVPRKLFVDSGAWIALRSRRDRRHAEADTLFRDAVARRVSLVTTNLVLAETHRLTLFRAGIAPAALALDRIGASPSVTLVFASGEHHAAARRWLTRLMPRPITYTDAVSFAVMESVECRYFLGFDDDFRAAGFLRLEQS
jgi:predicted nucleic acid-binding protein